MPDRSLAADLLSRTYASVADELQVCRIRAGADPRPPCPRMLSRRILGGSLAEQLAEVYSLALYACFVAWLRSRGEAWHCSVVDNALEQVLALEFEFECEFEAEALRQRGGTFTEALRHFGLLLDTQDFRNLLGLSDSV